MSTKPASPRSADDAKGSQATQDEEPGSNAVEHEPDPKAEPIPDGEHKYIKRSPYTAGND
ncbi:MAG TPA: hypothetical protein VNS31_09465 [Ramlibacter sp.]|jgi:hypothetical protein|nr:hypothetical protein [Ramlibacter sp.]